jgi:hypothetical protein
MMGFASILEGIRRSVLGVNVVEEKRILHYAQDDIKGSKEAQRE